MSFYGQDPYGYGIYGQPNYYPPYPARYYAPNTFPRRSKPRPPKDNAQLWCDICGVGCIGQQSYAEHCNGKKHQLLARKAQPSNTTPDPTPVQPNPAAPLSSSSGSMRYTPYDGTTSPLESPKSSQGKFFCEICHVYSTDQNTFNLHLTGKKHKTILQRSPGILQPQASTSGDAQSSTAPSYIHPPRYNIPSAPKSTFAPMLINNPSNIADDNLLTSKIEILSPTAEHIVPLSRLVQTILAKLGEFKVEGADEPARPVVLDVTLVGPYARGTLIKGYLFADIVVITKDPPSDGMLDVFQNALRIVLPSAVIDVNKEKLDMYVRMPNDVCVHLMFTWADALDVEVDAPPTRPPTPPSEELAGVNIDACQRALMLVRQMQFFSDNSLSPNLRPCLKILKDLRNRMPVFAALNNWAIEVIVINALRTLPLSASLSQSLRAIFAFMASGMLLPGVEFMDPCQQVPESVLRDLESQARLDITEAAQKILNAMAFGKWEEILGL